MTKSELIQTIHKKQPHLLYQDTRAAVNFILELMAGALVEKQRIEIRGFGSFSLRYHAQRLGRNPRNGTVVPLMDRYLPRFRPGKALRLRTNKNAT